MNILQFFIIYSCVLSQKLDVCQKIFEAQKEIRKDIQGRQEKLLNSIVSANHEIRKLRKAIKEHNLDALKCVNCWAFKNNECNFFGVTIDWNVNEIPINCPLDAILEKDKKEENNEN